MDIITFRSRFINVCNTQELIDNLLDKLPFNSDNNCKIQHVQGSIKCCKCTVDCNINDVDNFVSRYNEKTNETLKVASTKSIKSRKNEFIQYVYFRCHHNTRYQPTMNSKEIIKEKPFKRFKNKDCPFSMVLKFRRDKTSPFNCSLEMEWIHNHSINSLQSLSFKKINENVRQEILSYFDQGFTPGLAYREYWRLTQETCLKRHV